ELAAARVTAKVPESSATAAIQSHNFSDSGNAERLVSTYGDQIRFVASWDKWIAWDGKRWRVGGARLVVSDFAKETMRRFAISGDDDARGWALASENQGRRNAMVSLAACEPRVRISHESLDADP